MARPNKTGLDYFALDVTPDSKFELLEAKHGLIGFAILVKLYQLIYRSGYYTDWNEDMLLIFKKNVNVEMDIIRNIIEDCLKYSIFDRELFDKFGILTSSGIQKRYFSACERRKSIIADRRFVIVDTNQFNANINWINVCNNGVNVNINSVNDSNNSLVQVEVIQQTKPKTKRPQLEFKLKGIDSNFQPIIAEWLAYKKSRKETYKSDKSVQAFAEKLIEMSEGSPEVATQICKQSMANNWAGIFKLKVEHESNRRLNTETRKQRIAEEAARISGAC